MAFSTPRVPFSSSSSSAKLKGKRRNVAVVASLALLFALLSAVAALRGAVATDATAATAFAVAQQQRRPRSRDLDDAVQMLQQRRRLKEPHSLLPFFVNPFSPMLLCDWHVTGKPDQSPNSSVWGDELSLRPLNASVAAAKAGAVRACETVCVDVTAFDEFVDQILPLLPERVVFFTHRWRQPQLHRSNRTDGVRSHPKVAHWFAQNPIYRQDARFSAFPYGVRAEMLPDFADAFLGYHDHDGGGGGGKEGGSSSSSSSSTKNTTIEHLHLGPTHPSRERLIARRAAAGLGQRDSVPEYYAKIARTAFTTSPRGDRPDCYRHWESVALGAMPIANIDRELYGPLFGDDMVYVGDTDEMIDFLDDPGSLEPRYRAPRSERVLTRFWARKVDEKVRQCLAEEEESKK
jgi:hypothetical protein